MSVDTGEPLTILRIKRKRGEEPVDALVLSDSKRRKKGLDVFQFVQTVEQEDSWNTKDIQERISALAKTAPAETDSPTPSPKPGKDLATSKAYAITNPPLATAKRPRNAPPKVVSHKLLNRAQDVQCYDAVPVSEPEETQAEVEKFIPMLEEYLKLSDIQPTTSGASSASDYVWDIFYHRTSKSTDWNKISQNIGTLTGLPASFGDPDESDPEFEVEDEGDEDSNAEDWFTNDYPDEEDVDSEEGAPPDTDEDSEDNGLDVGNDNDSDEEWMTSRMYRR